MKKKEPASADVAKLAGVSRSAVSRTFTPNAYVSAETRAKVIAAAEMLGYRPNAIARSLSKRRSGLVGVVCSDLNNPFYAKLLELLSTTLQQRGLGILLLVGDASRMDELLERLLSYQVDGILLPASKLTSRLAVQLNQSGRPVVLVNHHLREGSVTTVGGDNYAGGLMVADLLVSKGFSRIAYVSGPQDTSSAVDRGRGIQDGLAKHGLALAARASGEDRRDVTQDVVRQFMGMQNPPDAIFCANDLMALAAMEVVQGEFAKSVPDDVGIVGYDNTALAESTLHALTSVDQNLPLMAAEAVRVLMDKIEGRPLEVSHIDITPQLVLRSTSR
jgi:DNA-binding LacI/PurR family transcriptional regulator